MSLLSFFDFKPAPFGLDIGELSLKLVKLKTRGKKIFIDSTGELALPPGIIVDGEIKKPEELIKQIHKLIKTAKGGKISTKEVVSVLPEPKTFIKLIQVLPVKDTDLVKAIEKEIERHIPMEISEMYFDWQIIDNPLLAQQDADKIYVLVGACPKTIVDQYSSVLEQAGLTPLVFEIEAATITRCLMTEGQKNADSNSAKIIIDFGAARTGIIVYDQNSIQFSISIPISGAEITEAIAQDLSLSLKQAEEVKIVCGLDKKKCQGSLRKILHDRVDELVKNIKNTSNFYKNHFPYANKVGKVLIVGGGANLINIDEVLSQKLDLPVESGNLFANLSAPDGKTPIAKEKALSFATAIGLALRGLNEKEL